MELKSLLPNRLAELQHTVTLTEWSRLLRMSAIISARALHVGNAFHLCIPGQYVD